MRVGISDFVYPYGVAARGNDPIDAAKAQNWTWTFGRAALIVAIHFGLQKLSLEFVVYPGHVSILWLPEGFLIAILCLIPKREWALPLILVLPTIVLGDASAGKAPLAAFGLAITNVLEAILGAMLLLKGGEGLSRQSSLAKMVLTILGAGAIPSAVGGLLGAWVMTTLGSATSYWHVWGTWSAATFVGILMTLPLTLALLNPVDRKSIATWLGAVEFVALLAASAGTGAMVFSQTSITNGSFGSGIYATFPIYIWGALRFGVLGAGASFLIVGLAASGFTSAGYGPFSIVTESVDRRVLLLQLYMMVAAISTQLLAAASVQREETSERLAQEELRYRSLVEQASDGIFVTDALGNCVEVNQAGCDLLGYSRDELIGMNLQMVLEPDQREQAPARLDAIQKGVRFFDDRSLIRKDGSRVLVEINATSIADGRILGICRDLSERTAHESIVQALVSGTASATGERFFALAVENLSSALSAQHALIAELDSPSGSTYRVLAMVDGDPSLLNQSLPISGTAAEKIVTLGRYVCGEDAQGQFPSDPILNRAQAESVLGVALRDGSGTPVGFAMVTHDQRRHAVEPDMSVMSIFGSRAGAEIERMRGERALRMSETRQRALLQAFPDTLFVMTSDGVYIDYHTLEPDRLRKPPTEFLGRSYRDVMPPDIAVNYDKAFEQIRRGKRPKVFEYVSDFHKVRRHYEVRHVAVDEGLVLAILRDITERKNFDAEIKRLNENLEKLVAERTVQLEAANQELESFAYSVSHDLRAPLRAIFSNAEMLREDLGTAATDSEAESIRRINLRAQEMTQLIDGLLKLSRIMRAELQRQSIDLSEMAHRILDSLARSLESRNIEFEIEPKIFAEGDPALLYALLQNLFENAVKFTGPVKKARIEFRTKVEDGELVYFVRDNGAGFNPDHADKLFRPFERLHAEEEFAGTGIGLATVQRIVTRHGGRIWAEGKPGAGATFYFTLAMKAG